MVKRALCLFGLVLLTLPLSAGGEKEKVREKPKYSDTTYVPTANEVIDKMLEMAKVTKDDVIFDLGCGDNRILFTAAKKYGARGVGLDLNPLRIREAMDQFEKFNKNDEIGTLVETRHGDALKVKDIGDATVVVMYMYPAFMDLWFPIAQAKLKPGTRIVSHDYSWTKGWEPVDKAFVKSSTRDDHKVLLWIVPEKKSAAPAK